MFTVKLVAGHDNSTANIKSQGLEQLCGRHASAKARKNLSTDHRRAHEARFLFKGLLAANGYKRSI